MTENEMAVDYYKAGLSQCNGKSIMPNYVPKRILLTSIVKSDVPFDSIIASKGEYDAKVNKWGAVSIEINRKMLGIKPAEFDVIEWQKNPLKQ